MNSELEKNFSALIRDPARFNKEYGSKQIALSDFKFPKDSVLEVDFQGWKFTAVVFEESKILRSSFKGAVFTDCSFRLADIRKCEFSDCIFKNCRFQGSKLDENTFAGGRWEDNASSKWQGFDPEFEKNRFSKTQFLRNAFPDASFGASQFDQAGFVGNNLAQTSLGDCIFTKPLFSKNKLLDATFYAAKISGAIYEGNHSQGEFLGTSIRDSKFTFVTNAEHKGEGLDGAELTDCIVDLKNFEGGFGAGGGSGNVFENLEYKPASFGMGADKHPYHDVKVRKIKCAMMTLDDGKYENCLFENIDTDYLNMASATLKNCTFKNVLIREFADFRGGKFENVKWENVTKGTAFKSKAQGSPYEAKLPF